MLRRPGPRCHPCPLRRGLWLWLAFVLTAAEAQGGCPPRLCGEVNISFPFGVASEPGGAENRCAMIGFQVLCENGSTPYLGYNLLGHRLQILDIFYGNASLLVADVHELAYLNSPAPGHSRCRVPTDNSSSKIALPFSIGAGNQNLILYNCSKAPARWRDLGLVQTTCHNDSFARVGGNYSDMGAGYDDYYLEGCSATLVPVLGRNGKANASNYQELIREGFLLTWPRTPLAGSKKTKGRMILIVLTAAGASLLFPFIYVVIWHRKGKTLWCLLCTKNCSATETNIEALILSYGSLAPKRYKYSEVTKITTSLNNKLGEGGYGVVFKGTLHDGRLVAVKFLHDSKGKGEEFVNEVMSIGRTSHVNVVSLFGFCLEGSKRALIYEYMPNGSLDKYIYSENPKEILGWEKLYKIAIGIARGLEYLHYSCNTRIVHFDIKPHNVLLDWDFCPKIADFGLAKLCCTKESNLSMTGARGTVGFIAPEVHSRTFGVVSTKSDIFSYGMMLLEMVGGRKNVKSIAERSSEKYFPDWIYDHFAQHEGLQACDVTHETEEMARKMTLIGLWCIQILPFHRPTITRVLEMFDKSLHELDIPPKQNFNQLLEDSHHRINVESANSACPGQSQQILSEVLQVEETSIMNSKILQRWPTL